MLVIIDASQERLKGRQVLAFSEPDPSEAATRPGIRALVLRNDIESVARLALDLESVLVQFVVGKDG